MCQGAPRRSASLLFRVCFLGACDAPVQVVILMMPRVPSTLVPVRAGTIALVRCAGVRATQAKNRSPVAGGTLLGRLRNLHCHITAPGLPGWMSYSGGLESRMGRFMVETLARWGLFKDPANAQGALVSGRAWAIGQFESEAKGGSSTFTIHST